VGVCADPAAWRASGVSPVEAVRKLKGHILEVHITDLSNSDVADVMAELKNQKFKGICAVGCPNVPAATVIDRFTKNINTFSEIVGKLSGIR
jgi:sugar phosphate isomerase/epimerase